MKLVAMVAMLFVLCLPPIQAQSLTTRIPELFQHNDIPVGPPLALRYPVVATVVTPQGRLDFVRHSDGMIGIGVQGRTSMRMLDALEHIYHATPLEVYLAFAPTGTQPPVALKQDHATRAQREPGISTQPRTLPRGAQLLSLANLGLPAGGPENNDPVCMGNWLPDFEATIDPNGSTYWGSHAWGAGSWQMGDANVTLGSSSAGRLVFCLPPDTWPGQAPPFDEQDVQRSVRIIIQEYYAGEGWFTVLSYDTVTWGHGYGYHYKGISLRKLRMAVRDYDDVWWWGAQY